VTGIPLSWLVIITTAAAWEKLFSPELRVGFLAHARDLRVKLSTGALAPDAAGKAPQLVFNDYLDAALTAIFLVITLILVAETLRVCYCIVARRPHPPSSESPHVPSRLVEEWVRD
jgi:carbon starvation protein